MKRKVIDLHVHLFPDNFSPKAVKALEGKYGMRFIAAPTVESLKRFMEEKQIDISVVQPVATSKGQVSMINDWITGVVKRNREIKAFGAYYPGAGIISDILSRLKQNGINGIKLHPYFQGFYPDDKKMYDFYEHIIVEDMWVLFHAGHEARRFLRLRKKYPELKMILAHLGGYKSWDKTEKYLVGEDLFFDVSHTFGFMPEEKIKKIIESHGPDKVVFGSDFPLSASGDTLDRFMDMELKNEYKEKILYSNAKDNILMM